ncbi:MAG: dolichyl-phosphate-mannose--protein mannosyltransferase [Desulfovibrio sp.]|jgi:4-amino-4-deoxy-L-arabinose transferase-like glycosyltransferase|nr:dolichyl-phosphate-mannose--protein mannosyltransferase [Desulfovibrio sp.]
MNGSPDNGRKPEECSGIPEKNVAEGRPETALSLREALEENDSADTAADVPFYEESAPADAVAEASARGKSEDSPAGPSREVLQESAQADAAEDDTFHEDTAQAGSGDAATGASGRAGPEPAGSGDAATDADTQEEGAGAAAGARENEAANIPHAPPGFYQARPLRTATADLPPTFCSRVYSLLALSPLLTLSVMLLLQTVFCLNARDLWFSDEVRHADAFRWLLEEGKGVLLYMNGAPYPDKPPLYFWFLRALYAFLGTEGPMLHFTGAALSALLWLWAALALGRLVGRADRRSNLASGIMLLSTGYVMGLIHYGRMDLLFSALILCSHILLYRALAGPGQDMPRTAAAFFTAGVAVLVKGPLGLAFPLCSALLFVLWQGRPQRLLSRDFLCGLPAGLLPVAVWLLLVFKSTGDATFILDTLLRRQVLDRALDTFHHREAWYYYLVRLPLMLLPWTLLLFCLPWSGIRARSLRACLGAARRPETDGAAYLWCMVLSALALLSCLSGKILIYLLPVLPALSVLGARAVLGAGSLGARILRWGTGLQLTAAGGLALALTLVIFGRLSLPAAFSGLPGTLPEPAPGFLLVTALLLLFGALVWTGLSSSRPEGVLLIAALACTSLGYPLGGMVAPAFDSLLSPRQQALIMRAYADKGYTVASCKVYDGVYSFYAGRVVRDLESTEEAAALARSGKLVLALSAGRLAEWSDKPENLREIHRQWMENREYVLLAAPPDPEIQPADPPFRPAPDLAAKSGEIFRQLRDRVTDLFRQVRERVSEKSPPR